MKYKETKKIPKANVSLEIIHECIAEYFGVTKSCVFINSRKREIKTRRQWFHYFARKLNPFMSLAYIGDYYSNKSYKIYDHNTVRHSCTVINNYLDVSSKDRIIKMELQLKISSYTKQLIIDKPETCIHQPFKIQRKNENNSANIT